MPDWRTLQVFLSPRQPAVYEVDLDLETRDMRCSCPTFTGRRACRHVVFVRSRMDEDGQYPMQIHESAPREQVPAAMKDPARFRDFIVRWGRVEVL